MLLSYVYGSRNRNVRTRELNSVISKLYFKKDVLPCDAYINISISKCVPKSEVVLTKYCVLFLKKSITTFAAVQKQEFI